MPEHPGVITRLLGRIDAARSMTGMAKEMLTTAADMEKSLWSSVEIPIDGERVALIEEATQRLSHAEAMLSDAYDAVVKIYPTHS